MHVDVVVLGNKLLEHWVNSERVLQYSNPVVGGGMVAGKKAGGPVEGAILSAGYISLQSESHPVEFRKYMGEWRSAVGPGGGQGCRRDGQFDTSQYRETWEYKRTVQHKSPGSLKNKTSFLTHYVDDKKMPMPVALRLWATREADPKWMRGVDVDDHVSLTLFVPLEEQVNVIKSGSHASGVHVSHKEKKPPTAKELKHNLGLLKHGPPGNSFDSRLHDTAIAQTMGDDFRLDTLFQAPKAPDNISAKKFMVDEELIEDTDDNNRPSAAEKGPDAGACNPNEAGAQGPQVCGSNAVDDDASSEEEDENGKKKTKKNQSQLEKLKANPLFDAAESISNIRIRFEGELTMLTDALKRANDKVKLVLDEAMSLQLAFGTTSTQVNWRAGVLSPLWSMQAQPA